MRPRSDPTAARLRAGVGGEAPANKASLAVLADERPRAALPFRGLLLPGEARSFRLAWQDPPLFGGFVGRVRVATPDRLVARRAGFWVVPWRQLGALALFALALVVLLVGRLRRERRGAEEGA